jgi:hypothetical protein
VALQSPALPVVQAFDANGNPIGQYAGTLSLGAGSIQITAAQLASPPAWLFNFLADGGVALYNGSRYVVNAAGTGLNQILDSGGSWAANLPTTLPATSGVLWNNGGVLSIS